MDPQFGVSKVSPAHESRYYTALGRASDCLLRCKDCQALVPLADLTTLGSCRCGNKRMNEITTLNEQEMDAIQSGVIDFPYRVEFLAEFARVE